MGAAQREHVPYVPAPKRPSASVTASRRTMVSLVRRLATVAS
jgi:hypothetical protein